MHLPRFGRLAVEWLQEDLPFQLAIGSGWRVRVGWAVRNPGQALLTTPAVCVFSASVSKRHSGCQRPAAVAKARHWRWAAAATRGRHHNSSGAVRWLHRQAQHCSEGFGLAALFVQCPTTHPLSVCPLPMTTVTANLVEKE